MEDEAWTPIGIAILAALFIVTAFFALRWGDPAMPHCPKDATVAPTFRCMP